MLDLPLKPSAAALRWLFWLHASILILVILAVPGRLPMLGLTLLIATHWFWCRRHPAFGYGHKALRRLQWNDQQGWRVAPAGQAPAAAELDPGSSVHHWLTVLRLRTGQKLRTRILLPGDLPDESARQLRVLMLRELAADQTDD